MLYETFRGMPVFEEGKYLAVYMPEHHLSSKKGVVYIHRLVAEEKLGRPLKKTEEVHRIDNNKRNNNPDNLMVFKSKEDHLAYHSGCDIVLDNDVYVALRNTYKTISKSGNIYNRRLSYCPLCGNPKSSDSSICFDCYNIERSKHIPSKEVLEDLLKKYNYSSLGRRYGVSCNAVRKWAKKYGLL